MSFRALLAFSLLTSCGARTGLPGLDGGGGEGATGGGGHTAGGGEGGLVAGGGGAGGDGGEGGEGGSPPECDPETTQYIYLVTDTTELYSYYPATGAFTLRGFLDCPSGASPFSMGVDREGTAYVVYNDGNLFRASTLDASCEATDFVPGQEGFITFGMGFALDEPGGKEDSLYVAEITFGEESRGLATIDTDTLELDYIGPFSDNFSDRMEMTSSSDGNLYGYFLNTVGTGGWVVEIDKETATIVDSTFIEAGAGASALAFAWWGGDFYVFTASNGLTNVTRFDPDTGAVGLVTTLSGNVVGAGVSTCAPGQI
ncbi:MAG: hypothetical protein HOW73_11165 [Polyangiaceae bacterium]|nr:hypothetical protein [Polyangiaceae bacterium]